VPDASCAGRSGAFAQKTTNLGSALVSGKIKNLFNDIRNDQDGAAMAEYVVLLGLIVGALVLVVTNFSNVLQSKFSSVCAALGGTC
jgi:pilus assembly protein Flp/PilA